MPPANSPEQPSEILLISPELILEWVTSLTCWPNIAHFSRSGHQEYKTHPEWYSFLTSWVDPCFCLFMHQNTCHLFMTYFSDHFHQDSKTIAENWGNWTVLWPIQSQFWHKYVQFHSFLTTCSNPFSRFAYQNYRTIPEVFKKLNCELIQKVQK